MLVTSTAAVLLGVFTGVSGFTFYYGQGASYLSNDPRACVNCHVMRPQYESWQHASHHEVATCNDCHLPHDLPGKLLTKIENGYMHSKAFTFQDFHEPIRVRERSRRVIERNCLFCHGPLVDAITGAAGRHPREEMADCIRCHAAVGHGPPR